MFSFDFLLFCCEYPHFLYCGQRNMILCELYFLSSVSDFSVWLDISWLWWWLPKSTELPKFIKLYFKWVNFFKRTKKSKCIVYMLFIGTLSAKYYQNFTVLPFLILALTEWDRCYLLWTYLCPCPSQIPMLKPSLNIWWYLEVEPLGGN